MRPGVERGAWLALGALAASLLAAPAGLGAQQLLVTSDQNLQFGLLTPGVAAAVPATDPTRRAQLTIEGRGSFSITFQLPDELIGPGGDAIPLLFGAADGLLDFKNSLTAFDPAVGTEVRFNPAHTVASIYLGGQAQPPPGQPVGTYTATIVMMVVQTGN
ncbi:MAG: DUF4402 domain-containing protein [Gemmatimonadota bacterium]